MKIRDLLINEYQTGNIGLPGRVTQPGTAQAAPVQAAPVQAAKAAPRGSAPKTAAKKDPAIQARQQELINAGAKIKADGIMGPQTQKAEREFGAKVDALKAANQAGPSTIAGPTTVTNPAQATQDIPPEADMGAGQDGGMDLAKMAAQGTAMRQPAAQKDGPAPVAGPLGVQAQAGGAFGQQTPAKDVPNTQQGTASAPEPVAPAQQNTAAPATSGGYAQSATAVDPSAPPTPADSPQATLAPNPVAPTVGTGASGGLKDRFGNAVKSSSDDELAWVAKNGGAFANRSQYPGAGKWDPKTGRTIREYHQKDNELLQQMLRIAGLR